MPLYLLARLNLPMSVSEFVRIIQAVDDRYPGAMCKAGGRQALLVLRADAPPGDGEEYFEQLEDE